MGYLTKVDFMDRYFFIINPASRGGRNRGFLEKLQAWQKKVFPNAELAFTKKPAHATQLARQACERGFERIVAVGGDGTVNEVLQGIAELQKNERPALGILSMGTGGDFARFLHESYGLLRDPDWLEDPRELSVDIGHTEFQEKGEPLRERYFINIADTGLSGEVTRRVNATDKSWGTLQYLRSTFSAVLQYQAPRVRVTLLDPAPMNKSWEVDLLIFVVANGRYFGGGMCIAPNAEITDQLLDVLLVEKVGYLRLMREFPKVYLKKPLHSPRVHHARVREVEIESLSTPLHLDIDGESFQADRVHFKILPKGIRILLPKKSR